MDTAQYLEALLSLPGMYTAQASPDGRWLAWTWLRTGPAADVYAAPTDGSASPTRLTETLDNTFVVSWTPDSRAVIVEQDQNGNERVQLFRVDLDRPLVMQPLTEAAPHYFIRGGQLHPNGRWLIYGANVDPDTGAEIEPTYVYRHDLATGERVVLARPQRPGYFVPELNHTGDYILYTRTDRSPAGRQVWLVDIAGREDREILSAGDALKVYAAWFPDGQRVVVLAETATHRRLGVWSLASGALRWLVDDPARNIEEAFVPYQSADIVVVEAQQARTRCSVLNPDTGVETPLPEVPGNLHLLAPVGHGDWIGQYYSARQPADLVRFPLADARPATFISLSRVWERTPLIPADFTPAEDFRWRSGDGLEIQGWLYRAAAPARGTIVYVHGGPTWHSQDQINNEIQLYTHAGFNVLDPNYRGSTGFGLAYQEAIKKEGWGAEEQDDIRTGIVALIAAGIATPGKAGITGTSYGGYSAWHAITHCSQEEVAAAAPVCGMTDLVLDYENTRPDLRPLSEAMLGGSPTAAPERYYARSPIHFVANIRGKLLIVQGMQDPNVSPANVRAVQAALTQAGIPYELLPFADEGHGISKPKNQQELFQRLLAFFAAAFSDSAKD